MQKEKDTLYNALITTRTKYNNDKARYRRKAKRYRSILTELEEWTKSEYDRYYNDKENLVFSNVEVIDFGRVLDKIQKLKEKYK